MNHNWKKTQIPNQHQALSIKILQQHLDCPQFNQKWHYRSIIGKLNFVEKNTGPDTAYAVNRCSRFLPIQGINAVKLLNI
jgi:hypothetical protein